MFGQCPNQGVANHSDVDSVCLEGLNDEVLRGQVQSRKNRGEGSQNPPSSNNLVTQ